MRDLAPTLYLALPAPISTNALFANRTKGNGRGRVKTEAYHAWVINAMVLIGLQSRRSYTCPVDIILYVGEDGVGNMDSDNALKAPIDALTTARVILDDSRKWVRSSQSIWVPGMAGMVASITPATAPPLAAAIVTLVSDGMRDVLRPTKTLNLLEAKL
jgi:Holliday junction resolvase RusA-like endonuclease